MEFDFIKTDYVSRMIREHAELEERLIKLTEFMVSDKYKTLTPGNQLEIQNQHYFMTGYLAVLTRRLEKENGNG